MRGSIYHQFIKEPPSFLKLLQLLIDYIFRNTLCQLKSIMSINWLLPIKDLITQQRLKYLLTSASLDGLWLTSVLLSGANCCTRLRLLVSARVSLANLVHPSQGQKGKITIRSAL